MGRRAADATDVDGCRADGCRDVVGMEGASRAGDGRGGESLPPGGDGFSESGEGGDGRRGGAESARSTARYRCDISLRTHERLSMEVIKGEEGRWGLIVQPDT